MPECCNPYKITTDHSKKKQKKWQRITDVKVVKYRKLYPHFNWVVGNYLCTRCSLRLEEEMKLLSIAEAGVRLAREAAARKARLNLQQERPPQIAQPPALQRQPPPILRQAAPVLRQILPLLRPPPPLQRQPLPQQPPFQTQRHQSFPAQQHLPQLRPAGREGANLLQPGPSQTRQTAGSSANTFIPSAPSSNEDNGNSAVSMEQEATGQKSPRISIESPEDGSDVASLVSSTPASLISSATASLIPSAPASSIISQDATAAQVDLNTTLKTLAVTPTRPSDAKKRNILTQKFNKARGVLQRKMTAFAGGSVDLSPQSKKSCLYCNQLLDELSQKFHTLSCKTDKYKALTCVPKRFSIAAMSQKFDATLYLLREASKLRNAQGAFTWPSFQYGHPLSQETVDKVVAFYLAPENSRASPNLRDTVYVTKFSGSKDKESKHRMLLNLNDLFAAFQAKYEDAKISISKFASLRPRNCVWPGRKGHHITCVCETYQNFKFMLEALKLDVELDDFIKYMVCPQPNEECFLGLCSDCPNIDYLSTCYNKVNDEEEVEYLQWTHTDSTEIKRLTRTVVEFSELFESTVPKILHHDYVFKKQRDFLQVLKDEHLKEVQGVMIQVDFGQNYSFLVQHAVQGFHWTNKQATIHPFVVNWWDDLAEKVMYKTYCVINDEMTHDADTFHVFRSKVIQCLHEDFKDFHPTVIHYVSDGAGGQYKNFKNFANLMKHQEEYGVRAEWHFTATSHGKSTCDAITGVVKATTRLESLKPNVYITTPQQMFDFCVRKLTKETLRFVFVGKKSVASERPLLQRRYSLFKTIPGTRQYHIFFPEGDAIVMKRYSSSMASISYDFKKPQAVSIQYESLQIGNFYCFTAADTYQVGMLVDACDRDTDVVIQAMKFNRRSGGLAWPQPLVFLDVSIRDILFHIPDPPTNDGGVTHTISADTLKKIKGVYASYRSTQRT